MREIKAKQKELKKVETDITREKSDLKKINKTVEKE